VNNEEKMTTIERYEVKKISSHTLGDIDKRPGVYAVYCPTSNVVKFGRASSLRDRLRTYDGMCLAAGGCVIFIKYIANQMIIVSEQTMLALATQRFKQVAKEEYFEVRSEIDVLLTLEGTLDRLADAYTTPDVYWSPIKEELASVWNAFKENPNKDTHKAFSDIVGKWSKEWLDSFRRTTYKDVRQLEMFE
jgi:hypothetical protein